MLCFFSSRRRHTRLQGDWSSDVCSSDLGEWLGAVRTSIELSKREEEVLLLFISGMTVSEIAKKLYRSIKTVSTHKVAVMNKLGIRKDIDLIRYGIEMGWIDVRK